MSRASSMVIDYDEPNYRDSAKQFTRQLPSYTKEYFIDLFPIFTWIHRYNLTWLVSDIIAGVTVGIVVVPQGMGYAKIAQLPAQYGLYSSFVGVCIYCIFGTSKDITIGPTAVMSLLVGQTITSVISSNPQYTGPEIAALLALFGGIVSLFIGLVRLGIIVDFIPNPAIAGFMTGSAITISVGQWPKLFGISGINTQDSAYLIFGNFFKYLPRTKVDAAFGIIGLLWLYAIRFGTQYLTKRYPKYEKPLFFFNIMRNGVLVIFGTLIAYLINIGKSTSPISILKTVPAGFNAMGVPKVNVGLLSEVAGTIPSVVIILILEHVAIAKSFGRINDYKINHNQEIIAIGVANIFGAFFGAYPNTGSFSRTAIKARSGVRTPLAGIFSAAVVVLSLYALTPAFYYIPDSILAAVIIHAVSDLVSGPKFLKQLWHINPLELGTFLAAVIITFFTTVEYGIYVSVGLSIVILLVRIARPRYSVLGRIPLQRPSDKCENADIDRYIYVPTTHRSLRDYVQPTPPGVICFRFDESLTYPNSGFISDKIIEYVRSNTRRGKPLPAKKGDRAWNDNTTPESEDTTKTVLKALVFDFSGVNNLDSTGVQMLLDVQLAVSRYADRDVEWHFAGITSPSIRSALLAGGFGVRSTGDRGEVLPVVPTNRDGPSNKGKQAMPPNTSSRSDLESGSTSDQYDHTDEKDSGLQTVQTIEYCKDRKDEHLDLGVPKDIYPLFHWNVEEAVIAASRA